MSPLTRSLAIAAALREQAHIDRRAYRCVVLPSLARASRTWRNDDQKKWRRAA